MAHSPQKKAVEQLVEQMGNASLKIQALMLLNSLDSKKVVLQILRAARIQAAELQESKMPPF